MYKEKKHKDEEWDMGYEKMDYRIGIMCTIYPITLIPYP